LFYCLFGVLPLGLFNLQFILFYNIIGGGLGLQRRQKMAEPVAFLPSACHRMMIGGQLRSLAVH